MELQRKTGVALWKQIQDWLEYRIREGELPAGERLPTESELARQFGVNRHTVRRALALLEEKDLIRTTQGSGSFVREREIGYQLGGRTRFSDNILRHDRTPRGELLESRIVPATTIVATALGLETGMEVIVLETAGEADGIRICVATAYFSAIRFPGLDRIFRETGSVTRSLLTYGVDDYHRHSTQVFARMPTARDARLLRQSRNVPVLVTEGINVDPQGRPVEYCETRFCAERVRFVIGT